MSRPTFELAFTARPEHIDELGHVNNAVWVQWIQEVAVAHWEAVARPEHKDSYFWVIVRHEIDYLRAALEGDRVVGRTWAGDVDGPYTWWSQRGRAFDTGTGWRLDYQVATPQLAATVVDYRVDRAASHDERWSDHAHVVVDYAV